jgi:serine/threonine protein kinase
VAILAEAMDAVKGTMRFRSLDAGPQEAQMADFQFLRRISSGGYSKVFLARKARTGDLYAIKAIPKSSVKHKNDQMRILAEKEILLSVSARHMVPFCMFAF